MDKKMYCFHMGNVRSEPSRQNTFANQGLNLSSVWTRKWIDFIWEIYDLSQADNTLSQNQKLNFGSV